MSVAALAPRALRDLELAAYYIAQHNLGAARRLQAEVRKAARLIGKHRHIGPHRPELVRYPFRVVPIKYSYLVIYDPTPSPPVIARVMHAARDLAELLKDI